MAAYGQAGAVSYGVGNGGTVGPVTVANSVRGMMNGGGGSMNFSVGGASNTLVVGRPPENIVTVFKQGGISFSAVSRKTHGATPFDINLPPTGTPGVECRSGGGNKRFSHHLYIPWRCNFQQRVRQFRNWKRLFFQRQWHCYRNGRCDRCN